MANNNMPHGKRNWRPTHHEQSQKSQVKSVIAKYFAGLGIGGILRVIKYFLIKGRYWFQRNNIMKELEEKRF